MLVVQRFHDVDEQRCITCLDGAVEFAHISQTDDFVEVDIVGKRLEQFGLRFPFNDLFDILAVRSQQQHTTLVGYQVEHFEHACRSHQRPVETVDDFAEFVVDGVELVDAFEQPYFILEPLLAEHLDDVGGEPLAAHEGNVCIDDFGHALLELGDDFGREEFLLMLDLAVVTAADAVLDAQPLAGEQVVERLVEHHAQRARVDTVARVVGDVDKFNVFG